jgi:parallel beta-helix repeat protein
MIRQVTMAIILSLFPALGLIQPASATAVSCGQTLDSGDFVLESDLGPCDDTDGAAALTVNGTPDIPATLDLAGFSVICQDLDGKKGVPLGIVLTGSNVTVMNGRVIGCKRGVEVGGTGAHQVKSVIAENSTAEGFLVKSSGNRLKRNKANGGAQGFAVGSSHNLLSTNIADGNTEAGFKIAGSRNRIKTNTGSGSGGAGFDVTGGGRLRLTGNTASGNTGPGVALASAHSKVDGNTATGNGGGGYVVTGTFNKLINSAASGNTGDGFAFIGSANKAETNTSGGNSGNGYAVTITSSLNLLKLNTADTNGQAGITVSGLSNRIQENVAQGNGVVDLEDTNPNCGSNHWKSNTFGTKSQSCIK